MTFKLLNTNNERVPSDPYNTLLDAVDAVHTWRSVENRELLAISPNYDFSVKGSVVNNDNNEEVILLVDKESFLSRHNIEPGESVQIGQETIETYSNEELTSLSQKLTAKTNEDGYNKQEHNRKVNSILSDKGLIGDEVLADANGKSHTAREWAEKLVPESPSMQAEYENLYTRNDPWQHSTTQAAIDGERAEHESRLAVFDTLTMTTQENQKKFAHGDNIISEASASKSLRVFALDNKNEMYCCTNRLGKLEDVPFEGAREYTKEDMITESKTVIGKMVNEQTIEDMDIDRFIEEASSFDRQAAFILDRFGYSGDEILRDSDGNFAISSVTGDTKTAREWAEDAVAKNPEHPMHWSQDEFNDFRSLDNIEKLEVIERERQRADEEKLRLDQVDNLLAEKGYQGDEILMDTASGSGYAQSARDWAEDTMSAHSRGLTEETRGYDFDKLEDISEKIKSGEMKINNDGVAQLVDESVYHVDADFTADINDIISQNNLENKSIDDVMGDASIRGAVDVVVSVNRDGKKYDLLYQDRSGMDNSENICLDGDIEVDRYINDAHGIYSNHEDYESKVAALSDRYLEHAEVAFEEKLGEIREEIVASRASGEEKSASQDDLGKAADDFFAEVENDTLGVPASTEKTVNQEQEKEVSQVM